MPQPTAVKLRTVSRILEVKFDDGAAFDLPFEYLRVFSPSAEVTGHGVGEGILQTGKEEVTDRRASSRSATTRCGCSSTTATTPACIRGTSCTSSAAAEAPTGRATSRAAPRPA